MVSAFITGIGLDVSINTFGSYQQREIPPEMQARTFSWSMLGQQLLIPVGYLLAGPVESAVGLTTALAGCATVILAAAFLPLLSSEVRAMRLPAGEAKAAKTVGRNAAVSAREPKGTAQTPAQT